MRRWAVVRVLAVGKIGATFRGARDQGMRKVAMKEQRDSPVEPPANPAPTTTARSRAG